MNQKKKVKLQRRFQSRIRVSRNGRQQLNFRQDSIDSKYSMKIIVKTTCRVRDDRISHQSTLHGICGALMNPRTIHLSAYQDDIDNDQHSKGDLIAIPYKVIRQHDSLYGSSTMTLLYNNNKTYFNFFQSLYSGRQRVCLSNPRRI